jgi:uncharacterized membrane protein
MERPAHAIILIASTALLVSIVSSPLLAHWGYVGAAALSERMFSVYCHQLPERSVFLWGWKMPVCARCFGIYFGLFLGALLYPLTWKGKVTPSGWVLLAAVAPLCVDGVLQLLGLWMSNNPVRFETGLLFGLAIPYYLVPAVGKVFERGTVFIRIRR